MLSQDRLKELLRYDSLTGNFYWNTDVGTKVKKGTLAGGILSDNYLGIRLDGQLYRAHRLAWLYMYGVWPAGGVDHIDRNRRNNAINNLREADQSKNAQNVVRNAKGWSMRSGKYRAFVRLNYKRICLGTYASPEEATTAYKEAKKRVHPYSPEAQ